MSSIGCHCGARIYDNSDYHTDKAYFIPDMQWFEYCDTLSSCGVPPAQFQGNEDEIWHAMAELTRHFVRNIHQCSVCGRLYVADASGEYHCFKPESDQTSKSVLSGPLHAEEEIKPTIQANTEAYWRKRSDHLDRLSNYHNAIERGENPEPPLGTAGKVTMYSKEHPQGIDCTEQVNKDIHELWMNRNN